MPANVVQEYEVFKNERNALAFFFYKTPALDGTADEGPFWFKIDGDSIHAGSEAHHAVFKDVSSDILSTARERGVLMLVEFEEQNPVRCTPCYLSDSF